MSTNCENATEVISANGFFFVHQTQQLNNSWFIDLNKIEYKKGETPDI